MITSNYQVDGDIYSYADKFFCDSHDDKPSNADARDGLINGAILEETDTGKTYIFDKKANQWTEKAAGGGGGGGGSTTLAGLTDVDISNPSNGQTLVYNATTQKWENGDASGGGPDAIIRENRDDTAGTSAYVLFSGSYNALLTKLQARQHIKVALERSIDYGDDGFALESTEAICVRAANFEGAYAEIALFFIYQNISGAYPNQGELFILPDGTVTNRLD